MQKRFIWAPQLKKSLLKKVNPTTLPSLPVTPAQLQGAPRSSRTFLWVPSETVPRTRRTYDCRCALSARSTRTIRGSGWASAGSPRRTDSDSGTLDYTDPARANNGIDRIHYKVRQRVRFASTFIDGNSAPCSSQQGSCAPLSASG